MFRRAIPGVIAAIVVAGIIGYLSRYRAGNDPMESFESATALETSGEQSLDQRPAAGLVPDDRDEIAATATRSGMREYLLSTPAGNRHRILWVALSNQGFACPAVKSAHLVGNSGSAWRANCGDAHVYWISVDDFSRFSVLPMPYGDIAKPSAPESRIVPVGPPQE